MHVDNVSPANWTMQDVAQTVVAALPNLSHLNCTEVTKVLGMKKQGQSPNVMAIHVSKPVTGILQDILHASV